MKLYHGSTQNLDVLKPQKAKGRNKFENTKGIFLTDKFIHASLYAIGKTLKGKTIFGVSENKLITLGDLMPKAGYVYEVEIKNPIRGSRGQYVCKREIKPIKKTKVFPKNYKQYFIRVKSKKEILQKLKAKN